MIQPASQCRHCGSAIPAREIADDEVCACGSRMCLMGSTRVCRTTNQPRTGTFHNGANAVKSSDAPPADRMVRAAAVRK